MIELNITLLVQLGLFLVFLYLMERLLVQPLLRILDERDTLVTGSESEYERMLQEAGELDQKYRQGLNDARVDGASEATRVEVAARTEAAEAVDLKRLEVANRLRELRGTLERQTAAALRNAETNINEIADQLYNKIVAPGT
jgi:F-type H+-transporting ATPase subunit b